MSVKLVDTISSISNLFGLYDWKLLNMAQRLVKNMETFISYLKN